jgi:hypothetical protein
MIISMEKPTHHHCPKENIMRSYAVKSLVICALGAAVMAGCASSRSMPAQASAQGQVQSGTIIAIVPAAAVDSSAAASSSGNGASGSAASSEPAVVTVLFSDGTRGNYSIEQQPAAAFAVGDPVKIVTDSNGIVILSP